MTEIQKYITDVQDLKAEQQIAPGINNPEERDINWI